MGERGEFRPLPCDEVDGGDGEVEGMAVGCIVNRREGQSEIDEISTFHCAATLALACGDVGLCGQGCGLGAWRELCSVMGMDSSAR